MRRSSGEKVVRYLSMVSLSRLFSLWILRNCFGKFFLERGQSLVPDPPARIKIFIVSSSSPILFKKF